MDFQIKPTPVPSTVADLLKQKDMKGGLTLNDYVETCYVALWPNPDFRKLQEAVYDEDAVHGSCAIDSYKAAEMIALYSIDHEVPVVSLKKLATIVKSMNVVARRYHMGRAERRMTVGGQIMPGNNNAE
jgi:hypothetical protein